MEENELMTKSCGSKDTPQGAFLCGLKNAFILFDITIWGKNNNFEN